MIFSPDGSYRPWERFRNERDSGGQGYRTADRANRQSTLTERSSFSWQEQIDISSAPILIDSVPSHLRGRTPNVILDATSIGFMDSTGLHALVDGKRMIHESGTNLILVPSAR